MVEAGFAKPGKERGSEEGVELKKHNVKRA